MPKINLKQIKNGKEMYDTLQNLINDDNEYSINGRINKALKNFEIANIYSYTSENISLSFNDIISNNFATTEFKKGDIMIITTIIDSINYGAAAYQCIKSGIGNISEFIALSGLTDASKVIMSDNINLAGNYTSVGNINKTEGVFNTKGKNVMEVFNTIFSKCLQPTIVTYPSVTVTLNGNNSYEVGTRLVPSYTAKLSTGSYSFGPATGITALSWSIKSNKHPETILTAPSASFDECILGDNDTLKITAEATHNEGTIAVDNMNNPSNPEVKIPAGTKTGSSKIITTYRAFFYGTVNNQDFDIDNSTNDEISNYIRDLTKIMPTNSFSMDIPSGTRRVIIAYPASNSTNFNNAECKDSSALNDNIATAFTLHTRPIKGLNNYTAVDYKIYVYDPEVELPSATYSIKL